MIQPMMTEYAVKVILDDGSTFMSYVPLWRIAKKDRRAFLNGMAVNYPCATNDRRVKMV